jgi:8-oxo-dGTP pyrophosphatase MutT (NUDIX family)
VADEPEPRDGVGAGAPEPRFDDAFRALATDRLARFSRRELPSRDHRPAGVAVALVPGLDGEACFLLTRRTTTLRAHAGQWALPGGRCDPGEAVADAARRELVEELGVDVPASDVLGLLDDYATRSGFVITPVVVWAGDRPLRVNRHEVARAYRVPLGALDHPEVPRLLPSPDGGAGIVQVPMLDTVVHAPTAAVVLQVVELLVRDRVRRVGDQEAPVWAWR